MPFFCHWYESGAVPAATTENVAAWPAETVWLAGCVLMEGAAAGAGWLGLVVLLVVYPAQPASTSRIGRSTERALKCFSLFPRFAFKNLPPRSARQQSRVSRSGEPHFEVVMRADRWVGPATKRYIGKLDPGYWSQGQKRSEGCFVPQYRTSQRQIPLGLSPCRCVASRLLQNSSRLPISGPRPEGGPTEPALQSVPGRAVGDVRPDDQVLVLIGAQIEAASLRARFAVDVRVDVLLQVRRDRGRQSGNRTRIDSSAVRRAASLQI